MLVHGFTDTWRTWDLVIPALERHHEVLAVTLAGHAGGRPLEGPVSDGLLADGVEAAMTDAGFERADIVGNSLGGYVALQLAARGRAETVVALAPAGGFFAGDAELRSMLRMLKAILAELRGITPYLESMLSTRAGRRRATALTTENFEHIPEGLLAHQIRGSAACSAANALIDFALARGYPLDVEMIDCPVRIVWGAEDKLLPWPRAAARYRAGLPNADWVELDGVGHCPQLDIPLETARLILGFTGAAARRSQPDRNVVPRRTA